METSSETTAQTRNFVSWNHSGNVKLVMALCLELRKEADSAAHTRKTFTYPFHTTRSRLYATLKSIRNKTKANNQALHLVSFMTCIFGSLVCSSKRLKGKVRLLQEISILSLGHSLPSNDPSSQALELKACQGCPNDNRIRSDIYRL